MKLGYAIIADRAEIAPGGKLNVTGGDFDTIEAAAFPAVSSALFLAVKLLFDPAEIQADDASHLSEREIAGGVGAHEFRIDCVEPDSHARVFSGTFEISLANAHTMEGLQFKMLFTIGFPPLLFRVPGIYKFRLFWDDKPLDDFPLYVRQSEPSPQTTQDATPEADVTR